MGNLSFMYPTKNKKDFNLEYIESFVKDLGYHSKYDNRGTNNELSVYKDKNDSIPVFSMWKCNNYLLEDSTKAGKKQNKEFEHLSTENWLCYNHAQYPFTEVRREIQMVLHKYFAAYILDEGIHPEYMGPNYKFKI